MNPHRLRGGLNLDVFCIWEKLNKILASCIERNTIWKRLSVLNSVTRFWNMNFKWNQSTDLCKEVILETFFASVFFLILIAPYSRTTEYLWVSWFFTVTTQIFLILCSEHWLVGYWYTWKRSVCSGYNSAFSFRKKLFPRQNIPPQSNSVTFIWTSKNGLYLALTLLVCKEV